MNFAKEFEKSRSIILLRYGLYEFQSVKPSKEEEEEEGEQQATNGTPSKPTSVKKRKADDDLSKETADATENVATAAKRRATVSDEVDEPTAVTPAPNKNKRKTVANEESPAKLQKATPSTAKSLFEKIASKPAAAAAATPASPLASPAGSLAAASPVPSPTPFKSVDKNAAANGKLSCSVFNNSLKPPVNGSGNIFGYLSDASSAKNSGVEADAESESESDVEDEEDIEDSQESGQSDEPSGAASGAGDVSSQAGSNMFGTKPSTTGFGTGVSSAAGTRDSTPGRSLFDRITKDQDGQPVRADESADEIGVKKPTSSINQIWNPATQPLKFAPTSAATTQNGSLFGKATTSTSTSIFTPKSTAPSNIFGVSKQDQSSKANTPISEADLAGGESDKENDSQPTKKVFSEPKVSAIPSTTGASLFGLKPAAAEPVKASEPAKPAAAPITNLFGAIGNSEATSKLFGDVRTSMPSASAAALFAPKKESEKPKANGLFGNSDAANANPLTGASAALFGIKPAATPSPAPLSAPSPAPTTSLFGTAPAAPAAPPATATPVTSTNLFGAAAPAPTSTATSLFGAASTPAFSSEAAKPKPALSSSTNLFGTAAPAAAPTSLFGAPSAVPAKKDPSPPAASQPAAAPLFSFGSAAASVGPKPTETSRQAAKSLFGAPKSPPASSFSTNGLFGGSPMKQDDASPAKKQFTGLGTDTSAPPPVFNFGVAGASSSNSGSSLFGNSMNSAPAPAAAAPLFGAASSNAGSGSGSGDGSSGSFSFNFGSGGGGGVGSSGGFSNPFSSGGDSTPAAAPGGMFTFGGSSTPAAGSGGSGLFQFGNGAGSQPSQPSAPMFGGAASNTSVPSFTATAPSGQPSSMFAFGASQPSSGFNLAPPAGGSSTTGTNSPFNLGGGSSLATTPAGGTPEPSTQVKTTAEVNDEDGEKHEQISLTEGADKDEDILHEVRAKVLKFVPAGEASDAEGNKSKSPWVTQGVGALRLLKHKETNLVRLLLRAEPRGNVAMNRSVLPGLSYKADEKYVKMTTSNDRGDGLETWMVQVKTKDSAKALAEALETHKALNKK
ncbi:hypothetical protein ACQKWADRAFT_276872 [Trichoderma austrokoningii]